MSVPQRRVSEYRAFLLALAMAAASPLPLGWIEAQPRDGREVAAIFPPWMDANEAIARVARAGGAIVRVGLFHNILVAHGDDPTFADRIGKAGAWLIVDPVALGGCLAPVSSNQASNQEIDEEKNDGIQRT